MSSVFKKIFTKRNLLVFCLVIFALFFIKIAVSYAASACEIACGGSGSYTYLDYQECCSDDSKCGDSSIDSEPHGFCKDDSDLLPDGYCHTMTAQRCCDNGNLHRMFSKNKRYWWATAPGLCGVGQTCQCEVLEEGHCSLGINEEEWTPPIPKKSTGQGCYCDSWCTSGDCTGGVCAAPPLPLECSYTECQSQGYPTVTKSQCGASSDFDCGSGFDYVGSFTTDPTVCSAQGNSCGCCESISCVPTGPEICDDASDNDCNGLNNCADPACAGDPACTSDPECNLTNCSAIDSDSIGSACWNGGADSCAPNASGSSFSTSECGLGSCICCEFSSIPSDCELQWPGAGVSTCPAECHPGDLLDISYNVRITDTDWDWAYQTFFVWSDSLGRYTKTWCEDNQRFPDTNWRSETNQISCNAIENRAGGLDNFTVDCASDDDGDWAGGNWCDDDFAGGNSRLSCKIDVVCAPDDGQFCCRDLYSPSLLPDNTATAGIIPGRNCLGAASDDCYQPIGGFSTPDIPNGELYNPSCCGDDIGEYFVSDQGIMQGSTIFTSENRNCDSDGTTACCRSDSGVYNGYVKAGVCVANCAIGDPTPFSLPDGPISYINIWNGAKIIKLIIKALSSADADDVIRVRTMNAITGLAETGVLALGSSGDANASPVRISTPNGVKSCQETDVWAKEIGWTDYFEEAYSVTQLTGGDYAFIGRAYTSAGPNHTNLFIGRVNSDGNFFSQARQIVSPVAVLSGPSDRGGNTYSYSVKATSDGGYITVGGTYYGTANYDTTYGTCLLLAKFNSTDATEWTKTYCSSNSFAKYTMANSVIEAPGGGYIVAGTTALSSSSGWNAIFLAKFDALGDKVWQRYIIRPGGSGTAYDGEGYSIANTTEGGFIVLTRYSANDPITLIKFSTVGFINWAKSISGNPIGMNFSNIIHTSDGGYAFAGDYGSGYVGSRAMVLFKFDRFGSFQWAKAVGGVGSEYGNGLVETYDNGYLVVGQTYNSSFSGAGTNPFWVKFDSLGNMEWARVAVLPSTGDLASIIRTSDSGYLMAGYYQNNLLAKLDGLGASCLGDNDVTASVTVLDLTPSTSATPLALTLANQNLILKDQPPVNNVTSVTTMVCE